MSEQLTQPDRTAIRGWNAITCHDCACTSAQIRDAGGRCPMTLATVPAELDDQVERAPVPRGFAIALLARFAWWIVLALACVLVTIELADRGLVVIR